MSAGYDRDHILAVLKENFGFDALRSGQDEVVHAVMEGRDTLAIMPTGGGKSLCYQLPALCREGLVIVVSPLIALMKDQVDALQARQIPAAAIHSGLSNDEYRQVLQDFYRQELKILYVAPERFGQISFMDSLREQQISLLAIDEAHCLSQWGHDFRPDYLRLGRVREQLGYPQTIALTATATEQVRQDVLHTLQLRDPAVVISGFARENLDFAIRHCDRRRDKFKRLCALAEQWKTGIVYCSTRKNVMLVFEELSSKDCGNVVAYHAGMTDEEREYSQDAFISGRADIVVATNAFGMGIDRADVRFVAHFEIPGSVEAFYQEAGRAGRDGKQSACELLFNHADLRTQEFFFEGSNPSPQLIRSLYSFLRSQADPETHQLEMTVDDMSQNMGKDINPMAVGSALSVLTHTDAIARYDIPGRLLRGTRIVNPQLAPAMLLLDEDRINEKSRRDHLKIETITRFAYSKQCRHQWILQYFGEGDSAPCGHCDCCAGSGGDGAAVVEEVKDDRLDIIRKALAGVARASRRRSDGGWEGIYGRGKIMDMLRGSKGANMHSGLTNLSTYGILSDLNDKQIKGLFRALQDAGYIERSGAEMPLITLTATGNAVMMNREPARLCMKWVTGDGPIRPTREKSEKKRRAQAIWDKAMEQRMDKELYEHLAELRRDIAAEHGMPVYRIMKTDTLQALARLKPTTIEGAAQLKGIGPWIREHHLAAFIELIADYEGV